MNYSDQISKKMYNEIKEYGINRLKDNIGVDSYGADLHHEIYNMDYFIIGYYQAESFLQNHVFDAMNIIKEYEEDNFGEITTDLSNSEKVVNALAYIIGKEILFESKTLNKKWNVLLTQDDIDQIIEEIE